METRKNRRHRSRSSDYTKLGHFAFLFCKGRQRNVQRFITHVRSHCFAHYTIIKWMRALWLVKQLWFIVPVNSWKFRVSSELLYKSNRPQIFMVYGLINHLGCWENTRRIRKWLAFGLWFTNSSRVLSTSRVVYQPINHKNLWSIA